MGIDYYSCSKCSKTFPDCGEYDICGCCSSNYCKFCGEKQHKKYGSFEADENGNIKDEEKYKDYWAIEDGYLKKCDICSLKNIDDSILIEFLLRKFKITRKNAEKEIKANYIRNPKTGKLILKK